MEMHQAARLHRTGVPGHTPAPRQELGPYALSVLYGGFGTLSLVIGPVTWLADGGSPADAMAAADLGSALFGASRFVHLAAIMAALILMFHPAANPGLS
jgi:hypothetical protein